MNQPQQIVVRTYQGSQSSASEQFQRDAALMAQHGYAPVAQSWAPGSWGCGAWLLALVLCVVLIGLLVFVYLLIVKPGGTLTVTYQLQPRPTA
jgi:hypothetical protein